MPATTKRALAESLKKLLTQRGLDKITVKDIVQDCGLNRQTFYYHFHDIYELMEWIFQDSADAMMRDSLDYDDWSAGVEQLMEYLRQNRHLILNVYRSINHETVSDFLKKLLRPYILRVVQMQAQKMGGAEEEDEDFVADIYTLTAVGVILEWIGGQKMQGTELRLKKLFTAMNGSVQFMLRNLSESGRAAEEK